MPPVDPPPRSGVDDRDWVELVAASSVVYGQALAQVSFPVLVLDLPSRRIRAANQAVADLFAVPVQELIGRRNSEVIEFEDEQAMAHAVAALSDGTIDGYRAWRRITARDGVVKEGDLWCRAVDLDGVRYAVYVLALHPVGADPATTPVLPVNPLGPLVVGTADSGWLVERISAEIRELMGVDWRSLIGRSLLSRVHPEDIATVVRATESNDLNRLVTGRRLRLRHQTGYWVPVRTLVFRFADGGTSHIAFGLLPDDSDTSRPPPADRVADLQLRLRNIAGELRAAGVMDDAQRLPSAEEHPQLNDLTSRQWEILVRLRRGDRVPIIARELHLSQATVRNHLAAIFSIFSVHSQGDLLALLRPRRRG